MPSVKFLRSKMEHNRPAKSRQIKFETDNPRAFSQRNPGRKPEANNDFPDNSRNNPSLSRGPNNHLLEENYSKIFDGMLSTAELWNQPNSVHCLDNQATNLPPAALLPSERKQIRKKKRKEDRNQLEEEIKLSQMNVIQPSNYGPNGDCNRVQERPDLVHSSQTVYASENFEDPSEAIPVSHSDDESEEKSRTRCRCNPLVLPGMSLFEIWRQAISIFNF